MPDLENKIATWRRQMAAGGITTPAVLDELESHLREGLRARLAAGDSEQQAFESAVAGIGNPKAVRSEFNKIGSPMCLPVKIGASLWAGLAILMTFLFIRQLFAGRLSTLLAAHVITLTAGYGAIYLIGGLALYYVYSQWFGKSSPAMQQSLERAVRRFTGISMGLVLVGFALGMVWSKQNRGFYWGNSSREIGVLCVSVWLVILWAIQNLSKVNISTRMLACVGGNVIVSLAWFGAQIVANDPGLNHFASYWPLEIFVAVHFVILALGLSRRFEAVKA